MIRVLRWILAAIAAAAATAWALRAILERLRPRYLGDPERPALRLRARLSPAEHRAIVADQDRTILALLCAPEPPGLDGGSDTDESSRGPASVAS